LLSSVKSGQSTVRKAASPRNWLNNTTISVGMQNVLDEDPPFAAGSFENVYDESLATIKGRFCYVQVKKKF
jgi:hypothetical protein